MDANEGSLTLATRFDLAIKAFEHTAAYDSMIANYFGSMVPAYHGENKEAAGRFPRTLNLNFIKKQDMRYGENRQQQAAFYIEENVKEASVATATQVQGKALSYNNIADTDAALECVKEFAEPACVIVKHANPCGVAIGNSILDAYDRAYKTDPTSAFGGIIAFNRELDAETAQAIISRQFVEVIIAPSASEEALKITAAKQNVRVLTCGQWGERIPGLDFKRVNGGLLVQDRDLGMVGAEELRVVTKRQPTEQELRDALFCWKVAKFVKSNAIVMTFLALVATMDSPTIGYALERLRFPSKLVFLFLFTYRYLHVIADEWHKLHGAARLRGFAPKTNMHTYRTFGNMLGMVFVHSFDRSVRVYEAMILRGFSGRFQSVAAFRATSRDAVFAVAAFACMVCLVAFDLYLEFPRG